MTVFRGHGGVQGCCDDLLDRVERAVATIDRRVQEKRSTALPCRTGANA